MTLAEIRNQALEIIREHIYDFVDNKTNEVSATQLGEFVADQLEWYEQDQDTGEYFVPQWIDDLCYTQAIEYEQMLNGTNYAYKVTGIK